MSSEHSLPGTELSGGGQELAASRRESADLSRKLAASRRESADLSRKLAASRRESADLSRELAASRRESADLSRELAASRRESADLSRELAASRRESADLSRKLAASRRESADLSRELAASRRENADLGQKLETAVQKAEKCCCDAEIKRHEAPPPCRAAETPENESLESRSRRFARELFGRRSERRPAATGRRRGRRQGTSSHGRTRRPELPVREEESLPDGRTCPDCGKVWVSNGWKDTEIVETRTVTYVRRTEAAAPGLRMPAGKGGRRPGPGAAVSEYPVWSLRLGERPGGEVRPAPSAAFGLPRAGPARTRPRHVGGRPATVPAPGRSTTRSPGACRRRRSFTATKRGGRELGEEDGGNARAWAARSADAVRILAIAQRGSRP